MNTTTNGAQLKLGLIGDNIRASQSPRLHVLAGELTGRNVTYDLLIPRERNIDFLTLFQYCADGGYHGLNITYPYKERVTRLVRIEDENVESLGAVNTVLFAKDGPLGFNTDYSGFMAAYRLVRGVVPPGIVGMVGTGGVGRAIAFALLKLGATEIRLVDLNAEKAKQLATELHQANANCKAIVTSSLENCDGLVNCTPIGMVGYEGSAVAEAHLAGAKWAFDAVYTPVETLFLKQAAAAGLQIISGYELFFAQGVDAFQIFSGENVDSAALRIALSQPQS